jgi:hypothetical protein
VVELELEAAGVLPAVSEDEVLDGDAEPGRERSEQLRAGPALTALDPRQVCDRGVVVREKGLREAGGDPRRLDPCA